MNCHDQPALPRKKPLPPSTRRKSCGLGTDDQRDIPIRQKESFDGAIPSGNSVAFYNLIHLHRLTGEEAYATRAEKLGQAFSPLISHTPSSHAMFMIALTLPMCLARHKTAGR